MCLWGYNFTRLTPDGKLKARLPAVQCAFVNFSEMIGLSKAVGNRRLQIRVAACVLYLAVNLNETEH